MLMLTKDASMPMKPRPDNITFRISPEDKAKLMAIAEAEHRPLSNLMARIVQEFLEANEAADKPANSTRQDRGRSGSSS
jgi:predicted transcriptional regulator